MDNHIEVPFLVPVHLNEVVSAAQSSNTFFRPEQVHMLRAKQVLQIHLAGVSVGLVPDLEAGGDFFIDQLIQLLHLKVCFPNPDRLHPTANIHADQVGDHLIGDGHRRANRTPRPGMDVRHKPDAAPRGKFLIAEGNYLRNGRFIHHVSVNFCGIKPSSYFNHAIPSFNTYH